MAGGMLLAGAGPLVQTRADVAAVRVENDMQVHRAAESNCEGYRAAVFQNKRRTSSRDGNR
jgi:hypothetical protein